MSLFHLVMNDDAVSLFCLYAILAIVGSNMVKEHPTLRRAGWRGAGLAYIVFSGYAIAVLRPTTASALASIAFRGLFATGLACAAGWILLSGAAFAVRLIPERRPPPYVPRDDAVEQKEPQPEHREPTPEAAPPPPAPPTPDQRAKQALQRYESTLRLIDNAHLEETELRAARDRAKQRYLRDLDEAMK